MGCMNSKAVPTEAESEDVDAKERNSAHVINNPFEAAGEEPEQQAENIDKDGEQQQEEEQQQESDGEESISPMDVNITPPSGPTDGSELEKTEKEAKLDETEIGQASSVEIASTASDSRSDQPEAATAAANDLEDNGLGIASFLNPDNIKEYNLPRNISW